MRLGASWCDTPEQAEVGDQWSCPECGEHWTAVQVARDGIRHQSSVAWEQTWQIEEREDERDQDS